MASASEPLMTETANAPDFDVTSASRRRKLPSTAFDAITSSNASLCF
jgi:hypothetical protein